MNTNPPSPTTRRTFIKQSGTFAAASALAGITLPHVYAAESNTIQLAIVGCGGRGTGAVADALGVKFGQMKLVAMADVFEAKLKSSFSSLKQT